MIDIGNFTLKNITFCKFYLKFAADLHENVIIQNAMTEEISATHEFSTTYCELLFRSIVTAKTIKKGHVFDMEKLVDPFFSFSYVANSDYGKSLFAKKDIKQGELVSLYPFILIPYSVDSVYLKVNECKELIEMGERHFIHYSDNFRIFYHTGLIMNHACGSQANVSFGDVLLFPEVDFIGVEIVAKREIRQDQEITLDYGEFDYEDNGFDCQCGDPDCVGHYAGLKHYSIERQNRLIEENQKIHAPVLAELYFSSDSSRRQEIENIALSKMSQDELFLFYHHLTYYLS